MGERLHAFDDDALGTHDAVALAALVKEGSVSAPQLAQAAIARAAKVESLNAVAFPTYAHPRYADRRGGALTGVPTFIKDNTDVRGVPSNHGSEGFVARPAKKDGAYATQYLSTGMTLLGKSRLPEMGFNATTEFMTEDPARNPWDLDRSIGASSGGAAALVASGVVPIAHANDGGGSIRIPAAAGGLVGLKPTRGRHRDGKNARELPINIVSEGVVTRTVRDTAAFFAAAEDHWRNPTLTPVGLVEGPANRRLRIGLVLDTVNGFAIDAPTRAAVEHTAALLEKGGHIVEPMALPITQQFADDFLQYWGLLAHAITTGGRLLVDRTFDKTKADGLTLGLAAAHRRQLRRTPAALLRLRRTPRDYAVMFEHREVVLSPVVGHVTPLLGHISPRVSYDVLIDRLLRYITYTPLNNVAGTPAISLPMGRSPDGLPVGVQLSAAHGDERTLIELAYGLEAEHPFPRIEET